MNPFMVINELEQGISGHSLINDENTRKRFRELLAVVKEEYEDIIKAPAVTVATHSLQPN